MGQILANTQPSHVCSREVSGTTLHCQDIYVNLRPRPCFKFPEIVTIMGLYHTEMLTLKTVTILALLSGHRCQSMTSLSLAHMDININRVIFFISKAIKNTTRSFQPQPIELKAYNKDGSIYPVRTVVEYIKATEKIRKSENIIVSYHKHNIVTTQTVSRYVKQTFKAAGINTSFFTAHSTRHFSSSKTFMKGRSLTNIVKKEGGNQHQYLGNLIIYPA